MLVNGETQRGPLAVLAGVTVAVLKNITSPLWADTGEEELRRGCRVLRARGKGLTEENTQGRKDKRQSTNQLNTQASLDGLVTTKPGEEEEGGRRNYAGIDDQRRKKFEDEVATGGRGRRR